MSTRDNHQEIPGRHSEHLRFPGHWLIVSVGYNFFSARAYDLKTDGNYSHSSIVNYHLNKEHWALKINGKVQFVK